MYQAKFLNSSFKLLQFVVETQLLLTIILTPHASYLFYGYKRISLCRSFYWFALDNGTYITSHDISPLNCLGDVIYYMLLHNKLRHTNFLNFSVLDIEMSVN